MHYGLKIQHSGKNQSYLTESENPFGDYPIFKQEIETWMTEQILKKKATLNTAKYFSNPKYSHERKL